MTSTYRRSQSSVRIAGILGALDDKIELNRRMSETLEATARALFRSWFVDFDPVCGRTQQGLAPAVPAITAAHSFPDAFTRRTSVQCQWDGG